MDKETEQFCNDLLQSVREMKANHRAREIVVAVSSALAARHQTGLSQTQFADLLDVSKRTLQDWEQGRRTPSGAAKAMITIAARRPDVLRECLGTSFRRHNG